MESEVFGESEKENIIEETCCELGINQKQLTKLDNANLSRWKSKKEKFLFIFKNI